MPSLIGSRVPRLEDEPLLRGRGRFVDDIVVPGVLHAAFVRSPHPHALIRAIDKAAALALPGVHAVLALDDLAPVLVKRRMLRQSNSGTPLDRFWAFALADGESSYVGEAVALVVADNRYLAEDAASLVTIDYEVMPAAADCRLAIEPGAPTVRRELTSNIVSTYRVAFGDAEAAFRQAPHVFHDELWQHRGSAHPIETRGLLAEFRSADDGITVWASTQKAHDLYHALNAAMDFDVGALRVAAPDIGGGFGPKLCVYPEDVAVVAAAKLMRRSLKWIEDRREHFTNAVHERDQYWSIEIGVDAAARVLGMRGRLLHDLGAYALQDVNLPYNSASMLSGPYVVPALAIEVTIAATNKTPVSSVRGAGYPQAAFAMERMLDRVAHGLDLDRAEVRRRNLIPPGKMPYVKPLKARSGAVMQYDSGDYPACQAELLAAAGWDDFPRRQAHARAQGRYLGIGLSHGIKGTGRGPFESGLVRVSPTGQVMVFTGAAAIGQGLRTALAQICAEQMGLAPADVKVVPGDTGGVSLGLGAFASRQTVTAGSSVLLAARAVAAKARKVASHLLEAAEHDLELKDGEVRVVGAPQLSVKLSEIARVLQGAPGYGFPPGVDPGLEASETFRTDALSYANGCHVAEVEVDVETGGVRILRYLALQDSGRRINPMMVDGQVQGGIAHAIGNALFEWMQYDAAGQPVSTTFADYLLPTATEVPALETLYRETPSPLNPLGVKGVGEAGTIPGAAAVVSAVEDALRPFGVRISQVPIPPQKLLELIHAAQASQLAVPAGDASDQPGRRLGAA
ncbi:MAG TPA: xanthine dehydrogenase family protein molybdopterin-binding subunit [Xanthobacteraceae bacterium]|nr:xanthine dehydrogenase family protein molybdopterin-binding subunit [Xanthobacteraceae bacterium]